LQLRKMRLFPLHLLDNPGLCRSNRYPQHSFPSFGSSWGLTDCCCVSIGSHVDDTAIGNRLQTNRAVWISHIDTRAGDIIYDPALTCGVPPTCLRFQMIIAIVQIGAAGRSITEHLPYVLPTDLPAFAQRSRDLEFVLMRQLNNHNTTKLNIAQGLANCRIVHIALA
jgi:hypothetical protein